MFQYDFNDSLTHQAALYAVGLQYEDLPKEVVDAVKVSVRDYFGTAIAGSRQPVNRKLWQFVNDIDSGGKITASVIGQSGKTSVERAAMINGASGHALDFDDCQNEIHGHPSVVVWAAVTTLGEVYHISGKQAITAYIAGIEVMCKLCGAIEKTHYGNGWHATGTGGAIGAAVAASKVMGMSVDETVNTIGLACSFASGIRGNFGSMAKPLHAGWAAQNGVTAAYMTKAGVTAMPEILEKLCGFVDCYSAEPIDEVIRYFSRIGTVYSVLEPGLQFKAFPCCRGAAWPICAALTLRARVSAVKDYHAIKKVTLYVQPWQNTTLVYPNPKTGLQGKFSGQYCTARALIYGRVVLSDFFDDAVSDSAVQELLPKCEMIAAESIEEYNAKPTVIVEMNDGTVYEEKCVDFVGHKNNPMSELQHMEKYLSCVEESIGGQRAAQGAAMMAKLDELQDLAELVKVLY